MSWWRRSKKPAVTVMLDEHLGKKGYDERARLREKHKSRLIELERQDLPKDAVLIRRKNFRGFAAGFIFTLFIVGMIGSAFAVFYAGNQQIISTVTTGTAPFVVASTTKVSNLNADLIDGLDSTDLIGASPTMYLTSSTFTGDHNCDDTPSGCCAAGYHMCAVTEIGQLARRIEDSGTGRDATFGFTAGDVVGYRNDGFDCSGWSSVTATFDRPQCELDDTGMTCTRSSNLCGSFSPVWCCSD